MKFLVVSCMIYQMLNVGVMTSVREDELAIQDGKVLLKETTKYSNKQLDLVFVLDRSKSISIRGWQNVLIFVHSFLEHFTVNPDSTRIAVISFSTNSTIEINDLKDGHENKCSIISKFRKYLKVKRPYGYTATNAALKQAAEILYDSRSVAKKVVIVLTDGRSNLGPPPIRGSVELRSLRWTQTWDETQYGPQLEIFAFGVHNADMIELKSISSSLPNHTFHIDRFSQFYNIARSLHNDKQKERWDVMDKYQCPSLCHENAVCMCGTKSGQYLCVCSEGFEGNGDDCRPCARGFYKDSVLPYPCKPCSENMTTLNTGSSHESNCVCKLGFYKDGQNCTYRTCTDLPEIDHGYKFNVDGMVHDEVTPTGQSCQNTPGTSCHYRCDTGYRLTGHPGLVCQANGIWIGTIPECRIVDCHNLKYHSEDLQHGNVKYLNTSTTYQSILISTCHNGWRLFGDPVRHCTEFGFWSGTKATCVEARCQALRLSDGIELFPSNCSNMAQNPGTVCRYRCKRGYRLIGPDYTKCDDIGIWIETTTTRCLDIEPPTIICPGNLTLPVTTSNIAIVYWNNQKPETYDNSGETTLTITGLKDNPANLSIGHHSVKYTVMDKTGNKNSCTRRIHIVGKRVRMVFCPHDIVDRSVSGTTTTVYWDTPVFKDNNDRLVEFQCSRKNGSVFLLGSYNIICSVDPRVRAHNPPSCSFSIILERKKCDIPPAPHHGSLTCNTGNDAIMFCTVKCNDGYDFYTTPQRHYKCDVSGNWILKTPGKFWPDCSRKYYPRRAKMKGLVEYYYYNGRCEDNKVAIREKFRQLVQRLSWDICGESVCKIQNISVTCGRQSRKRRATTNDKDVFLHKLSADGNAPTKRVFDIFEDMKVKTEHKISDESILRSESTTSPSTKDRESVNTVNDYPMSILDTSFYSMLQTQASTVQPSNNNGETDEASMTSAIIDVTDSGTTVSNSEEQRISLSTGPKNSTQQTLESTTVGQDTLNDSVISENLADLIEPYTNGSHRMNVGSAIISFQIVAEKDTLNMTEIDLEGLVDLLWDVVAMDNPGNLTITQEDDEDMVFVLEAMTYDDPSVTGCDAGFVLVIDTVGHCVACPRGTFMFGDSCKPCPFGYYQSVEAQLSCMLCPEGQNTTVVGAFSQDNCTAPCPPGSSSATGFNPCTPCDLFSYNENQRQTACKPCPKGFITSTIGSTNLSSCIDPCSKDINNESLCPVCPIGTYRLNFNCTDCPDGTSTLSQGSDRLDQCIDIESCNNITEPYCQNGGQCKIITGQGFSCDCPHNYQGDQCQLENDECVSVPCLNNGTCLNDSANYTCQCSNNFVGRNCEIHIDHCQNQPCENGGSCLPLVDGFQCYCLQGYSGETCSIQLDNCSPNPCTNGGKCVEVLYGSPFCVCQDGFAGEYCETTIKFTCFHRNCQNNGVCIDDKNGTRCSCPKGFAGTSCELNLDECSSSPCLNHATCIDNNDGYLCRCLPGYTGVLCEEESTKEFDLVLNNNLGYGYIRYPYTMIPKLQAFTIFLWFRTYQPYIGTLVSYTVKSMNTYHEFRDIIHIESKLHLLKFSVMNTEVVTPLYLPPSLWHNIIVDWTSIYGIWHIYINGTILANGYRLAEGLVLPSMGHFTLGFKEDFYGGTIDSWNSFTGEISQFNVFDHTLSDTEIKAISNTKNCFIRHGNIISWMDSLRGRQGDVIVRNKSRCLDFNECYGNSNICKGNKVCEDQVDGYQCMCDVGFTGNDCDTHINECISLSCFNGGTCVDGYGIHDAVCSCPLGFRGKYCEVMDHVTCDNTSCIHGSCKANQCQCHDGWRGDKCDVFFKSSCELSPCLSNSTCIEDTTNENGYRCVCPLSEIMFDKNCKPLPCVSTPCLNNGICTDNYDATFTCKCQHGFGGHQCEQAKDIDIAPSCQINPCKPNGICIIKYSNIYCNCLNGYTGNRCEKKLESDTEGISVEDEKIIIYTCLAVLIIIIMATCLIIGCKIVYRRKNYSKHRRMVPLLNNESTGMTILHNPVFTMDDEDDDIGLESRQRAASGTYENPYAELNDIPYIDDFTDMKNIQNKPKECNIGKSNNRKNSRSSHTSMRSSTKSLKQDDAGYLRPIFTKNQLKDVDTVNKNSKILLPTKNSAAEKMNTEDVGNNHSFTSTKLFDKSEDGEKLKVHQKNSSTVYENEHLEEPSNVAATESRTSCDFKDKRSSIPDPCLRLQKCLIDPKQKSSSNHGYVNQSFECEGKDSAENLNPAISTSGGIFQIDFANPISFPATRGVEEVPYLNVIEPKPGEFPSKTSKHVHIAPCNRELPPVPK